MAAAVYSIIVSTIARVWTMEIEREMGTERYLIGSTRIHNDRELALPEQAEVAGQLCSSNPVRLFEQRLGGTKDDESHEVSFCVTI